MSQRARRARGRRPSAARGLDCVPAMSLDVTPAEAALTDPTATGPAVALPRGTLWLMAIACGASAANIYYNQPLLGDFAKSFGASAFGAGLIATAAQVGYGVGLLFFVPLGDRLERRRLVLALTGACAVLLVATALAPTLPALIACQLLVGVTAMSAQLLIPLAVDLTPPAQRGGTVGTLMSGLLLGILLARTVAGVVGDHVGWRWMFGLAAVVMLALAGALYRGLPRRAPTLALSYGQLMASLVVLLRTQPTLWVASVVSAISFGCFTGFWTVLSFLMAERFGRGATEAGLFGIVGVIGALGAPLAGRLTDRRGPTVTVAVALALTIASFALMWGWATLAGLIVGVLLMDLGVQSIQVAAQSTVIALVPDARSRVNTLYMVARFVGGAAGSAIGAAAWTGHRWPGVCAAAIASLVVASVVHLGGTAWIARRADRGARP